jgi:hypothetical protein
MPLYFFRIQSGRYSGVSDQGTELADRAAAWSELTGVCGDMIGGITRKLRENSEWQMDCWTSPIVRFSGSASWASRSIRAFSSEVETGSRQENASKQESGPLRFYRSGKL